MLLREIPLKETGLFPKIVTDYLSGNDFLKPFYQYNPDLNSFEEVIKNKTFTAQSRELLSSVLLDQYQELKIGNKPVIENIKALKNENTFTVTTGHQLSIFTGPLYFIYKILTTIKLAEELKLKYPNQHFVPVFWLASEDHDFAEVNHIHLLDKTVEWNIDSENLPVGRISTQKIKLFIDEVKLLFANNTHLPDLLKLFEEIYLTSENLSIATRKMVDALFSKYGLVVIEPDDKKLKESFKQIMMDDIFYQKSFTALNNTNAKLDKKYKLQIHGREINFFYLSKEGRNLIKQIDEDKFSVINTEIYFTKEQLQKEVEYNSNNFSPNVVLRPVYQEVILPNLAYIGGPGEIAYWLQLKEVFETHHIPFPVLWMRNSFLLINPHLSQKIKKSGLDVSDYFFSNENLTKRYIQNQSAYFSNDSINNIDMEMQKMVDIVMKVDNQIASKLITQKVDLQYFFDKLKKDVSDKLKQKSEQELLQIHHIKETLFPKGSPQERYDNILQHAGASKFIGIIYKHTYLNSGLSILEI